MPSASIILFMVLWCSFIVLCSGAVFLLDHCDRTLKTRINKGLRHMEIALWKTVSIMVAATIIWTFVCTIMFLAQPDSHSIDTVGEFVRLPIDWMLD